MRIALLITAWSLCGDDTPVPGAGTAEDSRAKGQMAHSSRDRNIIDLRKRKELTTFYCKSNAWIEVNKNKKQF